MPAALPRFGARRLIIVAVVHVVAHVHAAFGAPERRALAELFLGGGDQAKIMFGVLKVIFGGNRIAAGLRVARKLKIFLRNMRRGTANFDIRPVQLIDARERIVGFAVIAAAPQALVLSVSHGVRFR